MWWMMIITMQLIVSIESSYSTVPVILKLTEASSLVLVSITRRTTTSRWRSACLPSSSLSRSSLLVTVTSETNVFFEIVMFLFKSVCLRYMWPLKSGWYRYGSMIHYRWTSNPIQEFLIQYVTWLHGVLRICELNKRSWIVGNRYQMEKQTVM